MLPNVVLSISLASSLFLVSRRGADIARSNATGAGRTPCSRRSPDPGRLHVCRIPGYRIGNGQSAGIKALTDAACVRVESKPAVTAARYGRLVLLDQHITHAKRSAP